MPNNKMPWSLKGNQIREVGKPKETSSEIKKDSGKARREGEMKTHMSNVSDHVKSFSPDKGILEEVRKYKEKPSKGGFDQLRKLIETKRNEVSEWEQGLQKKLSENNKGWQTKHAENFYKKITEAVAGQIKDYKNALDTYWDKSTSDLPYEQPPEASLQQHANHLHGQMEWAVNRIEEWTKEVQAAQDQAVKALDHTEAKL